jgi:Chromatin remodeling factor Mit1 C-terminal Zn finger 2
MVRLMLDTLKLSNEPQYLVDLAVKYLRGVKGSLVQSKKRAREALEARARASAFGDAQGGASSHASGDGNNGFGAFGSANRHHENGRSAYPSAAAGGSLPGAAEKQSVEERLLEALNH